MRRQRKIFTAVAAAALLGAAAPADGWIASWGASDVFPIGQQINYQTLRQIVRLSAGGKQVRIRFSNETGLYPLVIGAAHIAKPGSDAPVGTIDAATDRTLTFGGLGGTTIPPGAAALSDPVDMDVAPLLTLAISLFVPRWTGPSVIHPDGVATTDISGEGDFTAAAAIPSPKTSTSQDVSADEIIAGMKQIIARVHQRGAKIYGAFLTPYEGTTFHGFYQPAGEVKREAVNAWIRSGGSFDAVIDFDAAVRDPDHPTRIRADYDVGDHLHPNDAGYRAMGDAVDLKLFEWRRTLAIRDEARPTDQRKVALDALHACRKGAGATICARYRS